MINVEGDAIGAGIVAHLSRFELAESAAEDGRGPAGVGPDLTGNTGFDDPLPNHTSSEKPKMPENGSINPSFVMQDDNYNTSL